MIKPVYEIIRFDDSITAASNSSEPCPYQCGSDNPGCQGVCLGDSSGCPQEACMDTSPCSDD